MMKTAVLSLALAAMPLIPQSNYYAFEQVTVANASIGFTSATISQGNGHPQVNKAVCRLSTAQISFRVDGTAPTTTVGTFLEIGDTLTLTDPNEIQQFRAIRTGSTSGVLSCSYKS